MYRHSKYESVNVEEKIHKIKGEIKQLQRFNTENKHIFTEIEELKTRNLNIRTKLLEQSSMTH